MHLSAPVPSLAERRPGAASPDLDAVIRTLLAKSPEGRFPSALAAMRALDAVPR